MILKLLDLNIDYTIFIWEKKMNEKIMEKLKDRNFSKKLLELETIDQVKKIFENETIKITDEEIEELRKSINLIVKEIKSLPESDSHICGGTNHNPIQSNNEDNVTDLNKIKSETSALNNIYKKIKDRKYLISSSLLIVANQKSLFPETKTWWL